MNVLKAIASKKRRKFKPLKPLLPKRGLSAQLRAHAKGLRELDLKEGRPALVELAADEIDLYRSVLRMCRIPMDMLAVSETAMPEVQQAYKALKAALRR